MSITIKTAADIEAMRTACRLASEVLDILGPHVRPGVTTNELDRIAHDHIVNVQKAIPAPLNYQPPGYKPYPKSICTSVNQVICHGIPNDKPLKNGDIVNLDITVIKDGYHGDTSAMFIVGQTTPLRRQLCKVAQESLYAAIKQVRPGMCITEIGAVIQPIVEQAGFSVVRDYCGHGIGAEFHEEPQILHYRNGGKLELKPGMCFTIEPMVNSKKYHCKVNPKDGWTVTTKDGGDSAQWEHTLLVTEDGCEVLTLRPDDTIERFIRHV